MLNTQELQLLRALEHFETTITLSAIGVNPNILNKVISQSVKVGFFVKSISSTVTYIGGPKLVLSVQYHNTDVSMNDVHIVSSAAEINGIMAQSVGNYKKRLVLFVKPYINADAEIQRFYTVDGPFYPNFMSASTSVTQNTMTGMLCYNLTFTYRIGRVKLAMMEREVDDEVERIARQMFLPGMDDATKAFLAHNYLAHTIKYTLNKNAKDLERSYLQSAYGALINKKCVCQGYAEAFKRLMDYTGVPCEIVCGQVKGTDEYHAWNLIRLNGGLDNYHVDVTWDSQLDRVLYNYFGLRDSAFVGNRTWNREFTPVCNSSKNLLLEGRRGVMRFKSQLLSNGVSAKILGC